MKKFLLGTVALVAFAAPAGAADLAARPYSQAVPMIAAIYDWSGFYIGANGGWGSSHMCWDFLPVAGGVTPEGCHDASGATAGGQLGVRWQSGAWVFGVEAQGNWSDLKGSNVSLAFPALQNQTRIDAFGLFTGQIGYAANNALFYLKGGAAVVSDHFRVRLAATQVEVANTGDDARWGGTVGVGVEYGFAPNWSAAVEYDHLFLQDRTINFFNNGVVGIATTPFGNDRIRQDVDLVTVRVNYRWGGPIISKY